MNRLAQQTRFEIVRAFTVERPHPALDVVRAGHVDTASPKSHDGLWEIDQLLHDRDVLVTSCRRICLRRKTIHSKARHQAGRRWHLAGQLLAGRLLAGQLHVR